MNEAKKVNCFKGLDFKRLHINFESLERRWFQTKIFELLLEKKGIRNALNRSVRVQTAQKTSVHLVNSQTNSIISNRNNCIKSLTSNNIWWRLLRRTFSNNHLSLASCRFKLTTNTVIQISSEDEEEQIVDRQLIDS